MDKLKELIESERRRNPKEFIDAERKGELLHYLEKSLKKAQINPALLNQYLKERPHETDLSNQIEAFVDKTSVLLDESLFEPFYQSTVPSDNMGIADVMAAHRSSRSRIGTALKRIKVACALSSLLCFGLGVRYGVSRYIIHAGMFCVASLDLLRISYNAYDKKYCSLYLEMIGGSLSKVTDTIFKFAKTIVGMADPEEDPLIRLRQEIIWRNLFRDTFIMQLYLKVKNFAYLY